MTLFRRKPVAEALPANAPLHWTERRDPPDPAALIIVKPGERVIGLPPSTRFRRGQSGNPAGRFKGVGVDIFEARRIAARTYVEHFSGGKLHGRALTIAKQIEAGARDDGPEVRSVLAAIRRGRVLGRRAASK